jgi:hypothetical protein
MLSSLWTAAGAKLHRTRRPNISLPYFYGDRDGIDWRRRYCIGCIGMGDVYHYSANDRFWHFLTLCRHPAARG